MKLIVPFTELNANEIQIFLYYTVTDKCNRWWVINLLYSDRKINLIELKMGTHWSFFCTKAQQNIINMIRLINKFMIKNEAFNYSKFLSFYSRKSWFHWFMSFQGRHGEIPRVFPSRILALAILIFFTFECHIGLKFWVHLDDAILLGIIFFS